MKKIIALTISLSSFVSLNSYATDCNIGETIFKNTLYGTGIGVIFGGLFILGTQGNSSDKLHYLPFGAAVGAAVGLGIGIVDTYYSGCLTPPQKAEQKFEVTPLISLSQSIFGFGFAYRHD